VAGVCALHRRGDSRGAPTIAVMTERKTHLDALAVASLVGCCFLWGLNQVAAKAALRRCRRLQQAAFRSLGGAMLVWLWSALARHPPLRARRHRPRGTARRRALRRGVQLHLPRPAIHERVAHGRVHLPVALRGRVGHAVHRAIRAPVGRAAAGPVGGLCRPSHGPSPRASPVRRSGRGSGSATRSGSRPEPCGARRRWRSAAAAWGRRRPRRRCCTSWRYRACCSQRPRCRSARRCRRTSRRWPGRRSFSRSSS
jgi:hypothetical protein